MMRVSQSFRSLRRATIAAVVALGLAPVATTLAAQQPPVARGGERAAGEPRDHGRRDAMRGGPRGQRGARGGAMLQAAFRGVNLTEAQRGQLRTIAERYRTERRAHMDSLRAQRGGQGARPDSAQRVAARTAQGQWMRGQLDRQLADVRAILTAEQRTVFDRNVSEMKTRWQERQQAGGARGERGGRRGPGARNGR